MKHPNLAACLHVIRKHPGKCQAEYTYVSYTKKRKSNIPMWTLNLRKAKKSQNYISMVSQSLQKPFIQGIF